MTGSVGNLHQFASFVHDVVVGEALGSILISEVLNTVLNGKRIVYINKDTIFNDVFRAGDHIASKLVDQKQAFFGIEMLIANNGVICDSKVVKALDEDWQSYTALDSGK